MKKHVSTIAFILGFGLLSFVCAIILLTSLAFLVGGAVTPVWTVLSLVLSGGLVYYLLKKYAVPKLWIWLASFVVMLLSSVAIMSTTIDPSWDGNAYHKTGIGAMAHGWNPIRQDIDTFNASTQNSFQLRGTHGLERVHDKLWVNHYPKGSWMFAANMYVLTGNIESGKALTLIIGMALFLLAFGYLYQKLGRNKALLISLLLVFNPISVSQFYSYYVDGLMGCLILLLLLACTLLLDKKVKLPTPGLLPYGIIFIATVLMINLKFTGLVYAGVVLVCYGAYVLIKRELAVVKRLVLVGTASVVVAVAVVGASSYAKNFLTNGNPLYPLFGKGSVNFIVNEELVGYEHMSYLQRFIKSNLVPTQQINHQQSVEQGAPSPKVPFTITQGELAVLSHVDVRQGGYGIWFGGVLLLSCLAAVYLFVRYGRKQKQYWPLFMLPLVTIGICILAVNASWWARYLPQLVAFPIIVVIGLYLKKEVILPNLLVFAMLFNVTLTALLGMQAQAHFKATVQSNFTQHLPCSSSEPTRIFSTIGQDGALYNVRDRCRNIKLITLEEFNSSPKENRAELLAGIHVVR